MQEKKTLSSNIFIFIIKLNTPKLFELVSQFNPDYRSKLEAIEGDLLLPSMGISEEDEKKLIDKVDIVFHSAATVRFDEPIK